MKKYASKNREKSMEQIASEFTGSRLEALLKKLKPGSQADVMRTVLRLQKPSRVPPTLGTGQGPKTQERASGEVLPIDHLIV